MADLAELGIRITSQDVVTADQRLDALGKSADAAETQVEQLALATRGLGTGAAAVAAQTDRASTALILHDRSTASARAGTQQLGLQINDLGTQISAGINPLVAFNQQLGQIGFAMSQMQGRAGAVGSFLAGPWGAAIAIAIAVVGGFATKILDQNDALGDAIKKLQDDARETDNSRRAKDIFARSAEGVREAIRDMNAELDKSITSGRQAELQTYAQAKANLAMVVATRTQIQAEIDLKLARGPEIRAGARGDVANNLGFQNDLEDLRTRRAQNAADLEAAQLAVRGAIVPIAVRTAEEMSTANGRINRTYDQMTDSAIAAARGNDQLANSLTATLTGIEAQREAALEAERARERAENATGRGERSAERAAEREYESLIEQSEKFRDSLKLERESLGLNATQMMRNSAAAQARKLMSEGATAEALALANAILDEADALTEANAAFEQGERIKTGTASLGAILVALQRDQAELTARGVEEQARMNAQWAIADLHLKEITPEMQVLIDQIEDLAVANAVAAAHDPLGDLADELREIDRLARRAGDGMSEAFGDQGRALSELLTNLTGYRSEIARINDDEAKGHITREAAARARGAAEVDMYGDMLSSARGFFKEGSDGYKALLAIEQVYRAFQFASAIQSMALGSQETAMSVANSLAKIGPRLASGAAHMFEMLGPLGFPAVAAMLALMATLGFSGGGGKGGGGNRLAANDNNNAATDTVRANNARDARGRDNALTALAARLDVRVTADRDGLNAYVVGVAQKEAVGVAAPMVAAAAGGARKDVMQSLRSQQQGNRRALV